MNIIILALGTIHILRHQGKGGWQEQNMTIMNYEYYTFKSAVPTQLFVFDCGGGGGGGSQLTPKKW